MINLRLALLVASMLAIHAAEAADGPLQTVKPATAGADEGHPDGVSFGKSSVGAVYVDSRGMTLYAMNLRFANFRSANNGLKYCTGPCAQDMTPLVAAADTKPIGLWKVVEAAQGLQWSYKGDPVFTYAKDQRPGSTGGEGYDDLWTTIPYIPPVPKVVTPPNVLATFVDGAYVLTDVGGHALYSYGSADACPNRCISDVPFAAGMANLGLEGWTISKTGDRAQWNFRGEPVYVSREAVPTRAPSGGKLLLIGTSGVGSLSASAN